VKTILKIVLFVIVLVTATASGQNTVSWNSLVSAQQPLAVAMHYPITMDANSDVYIEGSKGLVSLKEYANELGYIYYQPQGYPGYLVKVVNPQTREYFPVSGYEWLKSIILNSDPLYLTLRAEKNGRYSIVLEKAGTCYRIDQRANLGFPLNCRF
jgi:hypothetical protein